MKNWNHVSYPRVLATLLAGLALTGLVAGCEPTGDVLRAKRITSQDEFIGGPSAKAKLGDFLIENDKIRAIVGSERPGGVGGVFGGSLLDVDLRRTRTSEKYGQGWDSFSESFPLANLLFANPSDPRMKLLFNEDGYALEPQVNEVSIAADGSDGTAIIRVRGHSGYLFHALKMLNRDFLDGLLAEGFGGMSYQSIVGPLKLFGIDLPRVLARLQISFDFETDYILREGDDFLTIETRIELSPPNEAQLAGCPPIECDLDCEQGYVMREILGPVAGLDQDAAKVCPVCECADGSNGDMALFSKSENFFTYILGDMEDWQDPLWRGGVVTGDFLFYGAECGIFTPGLGYDYNKKIFENMWQGVGTMGSPWAVDWVAGTGKNVSYAWTTVNPNVREGTACPSYTLALTRVDGEAEEDVAGKLVAEYGMVDVAAAAAVRNNVVDREPIPLAVLETAGDDFAAWTQDVLDGEEGQRARTAFGEDAELVLVPQDGCGQSKLLVPLFAISATAVLTHYTEGVRLEEQPDGSFIDRGRVINFKRYLTVGDGDVASAVERVYKLRGTSVGRVKGVVLEEESMAPVHHADVYLLRDPRASDSEPLPTSLAAYQQQSIVDFGNYGILTQMQTDRGTDPVFDGDFSGSIEPGRYLAVAHTKARGFSAMAPVTITAGQTAVVNLTLPAPSRVTYQVIDGEGNLLPALITFQETDDGGDPLTWEGTHIPALGDSRYEHAVAKMEHTATGAGTVSLRPGVYDITVSRGFEYSTQRFEDVKLRPGQAVPIEAVLVREIDTKGYVAGDFHNHSRSSVDSSLPYDVRLKAAAAQGVEMVVSSDHDHLQYYAPFLDMLALRRHLKTQVGTETSPLELGHFNSWPLKYDDTYESVGDPPPWVGRTVRQIWDGIRDRADAPNDAFVLQVNHPRDGFMGYFTQAGVTPFDLERSTPGMEMCNPATQIFPCDFTTYEVMNGKHYEYLWTPTVRETHDYNACYSAILAAGATKDITDEDGVCQDLRHMPEGCDGAEEAVLAAAAQGAMEGDELEAAVKLRNRCRWHTWFRGELARCGEQGTSMVDCKRIAMEGLKDLSVRYMLERDASEQAAHWASAALAEGKTGYSLGCDIEDAMRGCNARGDAEDGYAPGCGSDDEPCSCETCVCASHPECCESADEGGTGWTEACASACANECFGCGIQPCTDRQETVDDVFAFWNAGLDFSITGNSDSHTIKNQIGSPRNYVRSATDAPHLVDELEFNRNVIKGRSFVSTGPFVEFEIGNADGTTATFGNRAEPLDGKNGGDLSAHVRVQTASWFRVDRVEIWRNGERERVLFIEPSEGETEDELRERIVDLDVSLTLDRPENAEGDLEDSWYVLMAYGVSDRSQMTPVYKRKPYGSILMSQVIAFAADALLAGYADLLPLVEGVVGGSVTDMLGALVLPDSVTLMPFAMTNPVWVDVDGDGFWPVRATDDDDDGQPDLPPFCSSPCDPNAGDAAQAPCGIGQTCIPHEASSMGGYCGIPMPEYCIPMQPIGGLD